MNKITKISDLKWVTMLNVKKANILEMHYIFYVYFNFNFVCFSNTFSVF